MSKEAIAQFLAIFVFTLWERWLGRTKKFKANSTIDLVANGLKTIITKTQNPGEENESKR